MSEMEERVAMAFGEKRSADMAAKFPARMGFYGVKWETFTEEQREEERQYARLAIAAMREPTEAMVRAGGGVTSTAMKFRIGVPFTMSGWRALETHRAMIDEALR